MALTTPIRVCAEAIAASIFFVTSYLASSSQARSGGVVSYPGDHWDPVMLFSFGCVFVGAVAADAGRGDADETASGRFVRLTLKQLARLLIVSMAVATVLNHLFG